jgi:hypothetical protein
MKKTIISMTLAAVLVSMFAFTGSVFAQAEVPPETPDSDEALYLNHDEMLSTVSGLTGLSAEEIEARIAAGETAYDIAISLGVAPEDFYAILPMGGYGMQADGQGLGQAEGASALRYQAKLQAQLQLQDQTLLEDGECLTDGVPAPQNLNLEDGTGRGGSNRGGRRN